ncbi:Hypothetical predicted protein [Podarcis lilfordi]|uniref:Uncharacterized protein n=1 Tax=Podarcis lilfordi TaxID=74358 RepID=A0AA35KVQ2_9SAUR|nr:Hypothetical predicted protein [Podarcis lilfordi]
MSSRRVLALQARRRRAKHPAPPGRKEKHPPPPPPPHKNSRFWSGRPDLNGHGGFSVFVGQAR